MSLTVSYCCWLSLTVFPISRSCCMSLTVSYVCLLSLTVFPIPWSCYKSRTVFHCYWLYLTVLIELLHVSNSLLLLLSVSHCLQVPLNCCMSLIVSSNSMELLHVFHSLLLLLDVSYCLYQCYGVDEGLLLCIPVLWSFFISLPVSFNCGMSLTLSM